MDADAVVRSSTEGWLPSSLCPVSPSGAQLFCVRPSVSSRDILSYCCPLLSVCLLLMALLHPEPPPLASNLMLTRIGSNKVARALSTVRINSAKCDLKDHHASRGGRPRTCYTCMALKALSCLSRRFLLRLPHSHAEYSGPKNAKHMTST